MKYRAKILVTLKPEVKDAKAQVLEQVIKRKNFACNPHCGCGKYYVIEIEASDRDSAKISLVKIADEILSNAVIEQYELLSLEETVIDEQKELCLNASGAK